MANSFVMDTQFYTDNNNVISNVKLRNTDHL